MPEGNGKCALVDGSCLEAERSPLADSNLQAQQQQGGSESGTAKTTASNPLGLLVTRSAFVRRNWKKKRRVMTDMSLVRSLNQPAQEEADYLRDN